MCVQRLHNSTSFCINKYFIGFVVRLQMRIYVLKFLSLILKCSHKFHFPSFEEASSLARNESSWKLCKSRKKWKRKEKKFHKLCNNFFKLFEIIPELLKKTFSQALGRKTKRNKKFHKVVSFHYEFWWAQKLSRERRIDSFSQLRWEGKKKGEVYFGVSAVIDKRKRNRQWNFLNFLFTSRFSSFLLKQWSLQWKQHWANFYWARYMRKMKVH